MYQSTSIIFQMQWLYMGNINNFFKKRLEFLSALFGWNQFCYFGSLCFEFKLFPGHDLLFFVYFFDYFESSIIFPGLIQWFVSSLPNVPSRHFPLDDDTSAKEEKYLAALFSSPARNASIFMSLGNSEILNLTLLYVVALMTIVKVSCWIVLISESKKLIYLRTGRAFSQQFAPKIRPLTSRVPCHCKMCLEY